MGAGPVLVTKQRQAWDAACCCSSAAVRDIAGPSGVYQHMEYCNTSRAHSQHAAAVRAWKVLVVMAMYTAYGAGTAPVLAARTMSKLAVHCLPVGQLSRPAGTCNHPRRLGKGAGCRWQHAWSPTLHRHDRGRITRTRCAGDCRGAWKGAWGGGSM